MDAPNTPPPSDGIDAAVAPRPHTRTVLGVLVTAAAVLSYFVAYPLTNALRAAEVLAPPAAAGHDPRLRWMAVTFVSLLGASAVIAGVFRLLSRRQLRRIDEMADS
jgi:predicted phage tail protein